ncbi:MAG: hypothetical protein KGL39_37510 [Patescibacteria group bacterium]|nr:hypothetical protein [Patescibacteria group bacterium]
MATSIQSCIRQSGDGALLEITMLSDGTFKARFRGPGDASFSSFFVPTYYDPGPMTFGTLTADTSFFGFDKGREGPDRWFIALVVAGESDTSIWASADDGKSWTRVS